MISYTIYSGENEYRHQRRIQWKGAMGVKPTPWISVIYRVQGVFRPQRVLSPPWKEKKIMPQLDKFLNTPL